MGITNEETVARGEEKERNVHPDTRGYADARGESESYRYQQERINRANSTQSNFIFSGSAITGGMLRQLIKDYRDQLAAKKHQFEFLQELIQNTESEAQRLEERIQEFEILQEELEKQVQENK